MYQPDISNIEKGRRGSGVTDLDKLDLIADYLGISLEVLLFGGGGSAVDKYCGDKMKLRASKDKATKGQEAILRSHCGIKENQELNCEVYECGPYKLLVKEETICHFDPKNLAG